MMTAAVPAIALLSAGAVHAFEVPHYVAEDAGIDQVYDGGWEFFVGGGLATFDCDTDGREDLYLAGGSNPAALYRNVSEVGGALRFDRLVAEPLALKDVTGAYPLDIDGDGILDLAVLRVGENRLLRALADFNLDGLPDLVVINRQAPAEVWRNVGPGSAAHPVPMGNWLHLKLHQDGGNRHAIGAWVEVRIGARTLTREVTVGGGHASGHHGWLHFGVGTAERARVRVHWPDGEWGPWVRLYTNQFARLERSSEHAQPWLPPQ